MPSGNSNQSTSDNLRAALAYLKQCHFSVIPVRMDKKPCIKWEEFQKRLPTEAEVRDWWCKFPQAQVGIVTGLISGLAVIDIDDPETGKKELADIIPDSASFPIAKTPSGGEHWYFALHDGYLSNNARTIPGCDLRANGGYVVAPPAVRADGKRYRWSSSVNPLNTPLSVLPASYREALKERNGAVAVGPSSCIKGGVIGGGLDENEKMCRPPVTAVTEMFIQGTRDDDLFRVANCLVKGGLDDSRILQVLEKLAFSCTPPYPANEIRDKILSAARRKEKRESTVMDEVRCYIAVTNGAFSVTQCYSELQAVTAQAKTAVRVSLLRLEKQGVIQRWGAHDGWYTRIDDTEDECEWWNATAEALDIIYPLDIHQYALTYSKNIILVSGEPNSGKSNFLLNFAKLNMSRHKGKIKYFNSEMSPEELRVRLKKFQDMELSKWREIRFIERSAGFEQVIDPDGINIIDYLELTDEFYKMAGILKALYEKLNKGIVIVAIQKDPAKTHGVGGFMNLAKPRLAINIMKGGNIEIVKAKAWAKEDVNPNGLTRKYKIVQGARIIPDDLGWSRKLRGDEAW